MNNQRNFADFLVAGGLCLLGLALLDGAMVVLKTWTGVDVLWETFGLIGGVLLVLGVVAGVLYPDSYLRRGCVMCWQWMTAKTKREPAKADAKKVEAAATDKPRDETPAEDARRADATANGAEGHKERETFEARKESEDEMAPAGPGPRDRLPR